MHILVDTHDAFGGLAAAMLEELTDDHCNKGILVFGVSPSSFQNNVSYNNVCLWGRRFF